MHLCMEGPQDARDSDVADAPPPPTLLRKVVCHGFPEEGEALENKQSSKGREDKSVVLRCVAEQTRHDSRSNALEEVGGHPES